MLPSIEKSSAFQTELKKFKEVQKKLTNENLKIETESLINKLISEVKKIDSLHREPSTFKEPFGLDKSKENISLIRKKLHKICKDHNESAR
jgi:regulator of replication initiation timing